MVKEFKEKKIIINLSKVFEKPDTKRARGALKILKDKIKKETRAKEIKISNQVNEALWEKGLFKSLRKIEIKVVQEKNGVRVYLPNEKITEEKTKETKKTPVQKEKPQEKVDTEKTDDTKAKETKEIKK